MEFFLEQSWERELKGELEKPYIKELKSFLEEEKRSGKFVYPAEGQWFHALSMTPFDRVRVVIVGQDPYHGEGQAHGLAFSVPKGVPIPPSLRNIFKELHSDLGIMPPNHGNLEAWARQGVLLMNVTLTVSEKSPLSHHGKGWERFTDAVIDALCKRKEPVIFVLWGKSAEEKCRHICDFQKQGQHVVFTASHPSPLAARRSFFGCRHFSKINEALVKMGKSPISWQII